jgi:hypothetical protein
MVDSVDTSDSNVHTIDNNELDVVVDMTKQKPLNDKSCTHEKDGLTTFVRDSDEIGGQVAWVCTKCDRGTFLPKGATIV